MTLNEKIDQLAKLKTQQEELAIITESLKLEVLEELKKHKIARTEATESGNFAIKVKKINRQVDSSQALDYIRNEPGIEEDLFLNVNVSMYKTLADKKLKETGELLPGITSYESEYISVRGK